METKIDRLYKSRLKDIHQHLAEGYAGIDYWQTLERCGCVYCGTTLNGCEILTEIIISINSYGLKENIVRSADGECRYRVSGGGSTELMEITDPQLRQMLNEVFNHLEASLNSDSEIHLGIARSRIFEERNEINNY